ncbi:hypothetical protein VNO77_18070 [Canavalia gladiata]|uniref:Drought induced 19 protein type zinc-binding domain-containing protein n=1 Tax=Canavalia gladiata TaxID=3824 RepID=A0AAN9LQ41_CANGL
MTRLAGSLKVENLNGLTHALIFLWCVVLEGFLKSMEDETLSFGLPTASRSYQSRLKSHFAKCLTFCLIIEAELFIDFDEVNGDDELRTVYPCPFCAEDYDLLELCCHIDLDHSIEAKSGICPVCAVWVGTNMVDHIAAQHGSMFKISFPIYMIEMLYLLKINISLLPFCLIFTKVFCCLYLLKDQRDEHWQSFSAGLSPVMSTSKTASNPLLKFLFGASAVDECEYVQPDSSSEVSIEEIHSDDKSLKREVLPSSSDKDQIEEAQHSEFVQGLLLTTILDPDF